MKACILTIGDEILLGNILNTNAQYLAEKLTLLGFDVRRILTVSDDSSEIRNALEFAAGQTDLVISTGGLGPTSDDRTKQVIAEFFSDKLMEHPQVLEDVKAFVKKRGRDINAQNRQQALVPSRARVLRNPIGTAPGLWMEKKGTVFVFLPGVPFEMKKIFDEQLMHLLKQHFDLPVIYYRFVHTLGIPEADLAQQLSDFEQNLPGEIKIAYLPSPEDIRIRLLATGKDLRRIKNIVDMQLEKLLEQLGDAAWGLDNDTLPVVVGRLLTGHGLTVATAESCTGGNIARMITSVSGSSAYFRGSVVAYANEIKEKVLGVTKADLESFGAVSQPVVEQMAAGVRALMHTDFAVATSGIAGPTGGTPEKPVGTTWIAVASPAGVKARLFRFGSIREVNIRRASATALHLFINAIKDFVR